MRFGHILCYPMAVNVWKKTEQHAGVEEEEG